MAAILDANWFRFLTMRLPPLLWLCPLLLFLSGCAGQQLALTPQPIPSPVYDYPFRDPWVATVVGTPKDQQVQFAEDAKPERRTVVLYPNRSIPEGFWYYDGLNYSVLLQPAPAPLVFVIAGTGADDRSALTVALGRMLYEQGFHVVMLPSPTHANFIVTASSTFLPGRAEQDADDLLRAMHAVRDQLAPAIKITGYDLTGYSLGAWHAAFVAKEDASQADGFSFQRVLLVNPPVSLYRSIGEVDAMLLRDLPDGIDSLKPFLDKAVARLSATYANTDALDFSRSDVTIRTYERLKPSDASLATLIGLSFRLSTMNMIFTSDVMSHTGYIFPSDRPYRSTTPTSKYLAVALRTSFRDYFSDIYAKFYRERQGGAANRRVLIEQSSLATIEPWLAAQKNVGLITNWDDVILAEGDLQILQQTFKGRATIFPSGGHMGNLKHRAVAAAIARFFAQ